MTRYLIENDRPECIGCGACESICPKFWEMDPEEPFANLIGAKKLDNESTQLEIGQNDFHCNMQAAEGCPVNVIHITDLDSDERKI